MLTSKVYLIIYYLLRYFYIVRGNTNTYTVSPSTVVVLFSSPSSLPHTACIIPTKRSPSIRIVPSASQTRSALVALLESSRSAAVIQRYDVGPFRNVVSSLHKVVSLCSYGFDSILTVKSYYTYQSSAFLPQPQH
jgi:hypothetical protein